MQITDCRVEGKELILTSSDYREMGRFAYNFKAGNYEIERKKKKRSSDANAYFWLLADKLAERLNIPKTEIYLNYIKEIGGVSEIVCVKNEAVEKLCKGWQRNGLGWQTDTMPSKIEGCTNVVLYYGSSTYNTEQMHRLLSLIIEDCEIQGIETKTPDELASLLALLESEAI